MRISLAIILLVVISACKVSESRMFCPIGATVVDHSDLDGCGKMLKTSDGILLLPNDGQLETMAAKTKVVIRYDTLDMMSTCMRENMVVQLSCLQPLSSPPCVVISDVESAPWMKAAIATFHPSMVVRYSYRSQPVYHLFNRMLDRWYDCHGRQLCRENSSQPCILEAAGLENKVEIYVAHR
ncbi:MAG: hypothetical protein HKN87_19280 [Saprospiraceae bacterium]|nr:hypothetical protein [Saprospiraceae bacterium]